MTKKNFFLSFPANKTENRKANKRTEILCKREKIDIFNVKLSDPSTLKQIELTYFLLCCQKSFVESLYTFSIPLKLLNVITLRPGIYDHINQMISKTDGFMCSIL